MANDKTVISIPSLYFYQYGVNISKFMGNVTYNEGIYLTDTTPKTYSKSVVRIYKNPNFPKKIYLVSKDTSLLQAISKKVISVSSDPTINTEFVNYYRDYDSGEISYKDYFDVDSRDTLSRYSIFSQPSNVSTINYDDNSLVNKTINLYTLSEEAINKIETNFGNIVFSDVSYETAISQSFDIKASYLLKAKSILADYGNDNETYNRSEVELFNASLFENWDSTKSYKNITPLVDTDLIIKNSYTIKKTKSINFSDFIEQKHDNLWIQKVFLNNLTTPYGKDYDDILQEEFTKYSYILSVKYSIPFSSTGYYDDNYSYNWVPMYGDTFNRYTNEYGALEEDSSEKLADIRGKNIFLRKTKLLSSNDNGVLEYDRELSVVPDEPLKNFLFFHKSPDITNAATYISDLNTIIEDYSRLGTFTHAESNIFDKKPILDFSKDFNVPDAYKKTREEIDGYISTYTKPENVDFYSNVTETRYLQEKSLDQETDLATMYVLNDEYKNYQLGFVPDDLETTVYELELDEELHIYNGSFVVVEIE